jgi:hypothetical protein
VPPGRCNDELFRPLCHEQRPIDGLGGEIGDRFEVCVVVKHGEISALDNRSEKRVDGLEGAVLAAFGQEALHIDRALVVLIDDQDVLKGVKTIHDGPVVGQVACAVVEFEDDGSTYCDLKSSAMGLVVPLRSSSR